MSRTLVGNDYLVEHTFYAADEETATDVTGVGTVTVTREDGTVLAGGTTTDTGVGTTTFPLTAAVHTTRVDDLTIGYSATVAGRTVSEYEYVKVVGARFFSIALLRAQKGLSNTVVYANADLKWARDVAEDFVEEFTKDAFVPQYRRDIFDGDDGSEMFLSRIGVRSIIGVTIDGVAASTTGWSVSASGRVRTDGDIFTSNVTAGQNITVSYSLGRNAPPANLANATVKLARHLLLSLESSIPDRARMMTTEFASYQLDVASEDKPTGIPEIDAVLSRYRAAQGDWIVA